MRRSPGPLQKEMLAAFLAYQFVPKPFNIQSGLAARPSLYQFPKIHNPKYDFPKNKQSIARALRTHLATVIERALSRHSGPIGLCLSGGLDSTILLHLLRHQTHREIHTVSAAYAPQTRHLKVCSSLAKRYNTTHQEIILTAQDLPKLASIYARKQVNPIGDNGLLAADIMFHALAPKTRIIFTGDGADCLFYGLHAHVLDYINQNAPQNESLNVTPIQQERLHPQKTFPEYAHYKYDEIFMTDDEASQYLDSHQPLLQHLTRIRDTIKSPQLVKQTLLLDLNFLAANRVDYLYAALPNTQTEIILPYLDNTLIEFVLRIPSAYFIHHLEQKYILKEAFRNILPSGILQQKKHGLTPPFLPWYRENRRYLINKFRQAPELGINPSYIRTLMPHINTCPHYAMGMRIWLILNLVLWHQEQ